MIDLLNRVYKHIEHAHNNIANDSVKCQLCPGIQKAFRGSIIDLTLIQDSERVYRKIVGVYCQEAKVTHQVRQNQKEIQARVSNICQRSA